MIIPAIEIKAGIARLDVPDGWYSVKLEKPKQPRSVGPRSQNSAIWGYCQAIAIQVQMDTQRVYDGLKIKAMRDNGYPPVWNSISGEWEPKGQSEATKEEASLFIQTIKEYADFNNLWLIEYINGQAVKTLYGVKVK
jgi:hypothetical protein